ncbi:MAG: hypothetical protein QNK15_05215, partial [Cycloclasticus sp.]|nr:hypothetical protein [Cycloclasticus sp.]
FVSAPSLASAQCKAMKSKNQIPTGYHPTSAQWRPNASNGDMVCIQKTGSSQTDFVAWNDFEMPADYYVVYEHPQPSTSFNGCKQWSVWQGKKTCIQMYNRYLLRKNPGYLGSE